ncbi:Testin [Trichinella nativa]|uniref:Testin n=1 Tax=Trichinella nativa TaxID=6335 RepID=A0A0V1KVZ9_9BILA|nr:Testin [Trichinella nativa]
MTELEMLQQKLFRKFSIHNKFMSVSTHSQNVTMKTDVKSAIYAFENKKKQVLAHEFGFGSPCRKCGEKCPGLELHFWRKICMQCKCGKEDHDIVIENVDPGQFRIGRLFQKQADASNNNGRLLPQLNSSSAALENFEWTPPSSVSALLSEKFLFTLPKEFRPIRGTEGAIRRRQALERQLPLHDLDINAASHPVDQCERVNMEKFLTTMKLCNVGQGAVKEVEREMQFHKFENCFSCNSVAKPGEVIVVADRFGPNNGKIFCGRHFGESLCPRCAGCDELIFTDKYTVAENCTWHVEHFCCFSCEKSLGGHRYYFKNNQPYCLDCYENYWAKTCHKCGKKIAADANRTEFAGIYWHANDECFSCSTCRKGLVRCRFLLAAGAVFCSTACKIASKEFFVHFRYLKWVRK